MAQHTPAPWVNDPDLGYIRGTDGRDWPVGEMGETGLSIEDEHARIRADRTLMAAAPEMPAALREWVEADRLLRGIPREPTREWADAEARCRAARIAARTAIAKAEGR